MKLIPYNDDSSEVIWTWRRMIEKTDPIWDYRWTVPQCDPLPPDEDRVFICPECGGEMQEYASGELYCPGCGELLRPMD